MAGHKLEEEVARALGSAVRSSCAVSGGDINSAHEMTLADGRVVFVKSNSVADPTMFAAEARGLAWLAQARVLRVPEVLAVGEKFLVLERISPARRRPDFDERLGRALAALHRYGAPGFGLDHDNFIGRLPQCNVSASSWPDFYRSRRLEPQLRRARDAGLCSSAMTRGFNRLFAMLDERVGPAEPVARLHGDLWGGGLRPRPRQLHRTPAPVQHTHLGLARVLPQPQTRTTACSGARRRPVQFGHGPRIRSTLRRAG